MHEPCRERVTLLPHSYTLCFLIHTHFTSSFIHTFLPHSYKVNEPGHMCLIVLLATVYTHDTSKVAGHFPQNSH